MSPNFSSSGAARKRFEREGRAVAAVSDDHVVPIYAVSEFRGLPYIVMKYIPGVSLLQRIEKDGPLDTCEVTRIGLQVAKALSAAHDQGIVHRDVKPANVLLENTVDRAMVTDFGLARVADEASMTRSGTIAGTPQYMSPEQAQGETVDPRSDLFSLGSLMYAACTARPPFRAETVFGVINRVCNTEPRAIREINPQIDEWLVAFVEKLMAKRAEDRFQSANVVTKNLSAELAHLQNPTVVPAPHRDWFQPEPKLQEAGAKPPRGIFGFAVLGAVAALTFAFSPFVAGLSQEDEKKENGKVPPVQSAEPTPVASAVAKGGNARSRKLTPEEKKALGALLANSPTKKELARSTKKTGSSEPKRVGNPLAEEALIKQIKARDTTLEGEEEIPIERPATVGLDGATVTWKTIDDDWNKSTTLEFDQKLEQTVPIKPGSRFVIDVDRGDVVLRTGETDQMTITVVRRVKAESREDAEKALALHTLALEDKDGATVFSGHFQRREQSKNVVHTGRVILNDTVTFNKMPVSTSGREVQDKFKRVLYKVSIPKNMTVRADSVAGSVSIGAIKGDVHADTVSGDIRITSVDGNLFAYTISGVIDVSGGCTGHAKVECNSGDARLQDVGRGVDAKSFTGDLYLTRIQGEVNAEAGGVANIRDCSGEIDVLSRFGSVIVGGATGSARVRASGAHVLLDKNPGDVFVQTSGGNVMVNELPGKLKAHTQAGDLTLNVTEAPANDVSVSSRRGHIRLNVSEELAAKFEVHGGAELGGNVIFSSEEADGIKFAKAVLNDGDKLIKATTPTGRVDLMTWDKAKLQKRCKSLGGSGLGGSGSRKSAAAKSKQAKEKTTGPPAAGRLATVKLDNDTRMDGYTLYLPVSYNKQTEKYPVLVFLSGAWGVGGEIEDLNNWGIPRLLRDETDLTTERNKLLLDSFIIVNPHIKGGQFHDNPKVVRQILDDVLAKYKADPKRIHLTGLSRGGHGTWGLAEMLPDTFASIAPVAGNPSAVKDHGALAKSAIWIAHNKGDASAGYDYVEEAAERIAKDGKIEFLHLDTPDPSKSSYLASRHIFTHPNLSSHDAWTDMYAGAEYYKWLLKQRLE